MKLKSFIVSFLAATFAFVSCYQLEDENLGTPAIKLSTVEMSFDEAGGEQQLTLTATRDWMVENDADWLVVSPESGAASSDVQTVTVTVLENTGMDRTADVVFTIGMSSKTLTVTQAGPGGSTEALIVYANDFDKVKAEKGEKWSTYLDTFDGWRNETGTGIETVTYASKSLTARTNSGNGSAGKYSDYVQLGASGMNYLWFGTAPTYFAVKDITLPEGKTDYTLSFGAERYLYEAKQNVFDWNEFSVYVSADANKWVKLSFDFAGGALPDGRWDLASTTFTVPAGTTSLNVYFTSSLGSAYAIDDLKLVQADKAGTAIDFAAGDEFEVGGDIPGTGGNQGGESDATAIYSNNYDKEAAAQGTNGWPFLDSSDAWKNAAGTGAANVTYNSKNVTVRNNSNSDGSYSDYAGSGMNNLFFGKENPYFSTNNIALNGATGLTLTFGTEKYSQDYGSTFTNSEYHIWLSADGTKWVELTDYTFAGTADGRWNVATADFTVPAGTANLSICMQVDVASAYRLDDFRLVASEGGVAVDFSQGIEKDFSAGGTSGGGNTGGGDTPVEGQPADLIKATVAEFLAAEESSDVWYELTGEVTSIKEGNAYGNIYINDGTAEVYIYGLTNGWVGYNDKSFDSIGLKVGDTVTLGTLRGSYNGEPQGGGSKVPAFYISHIPGEGGGNEGGEDPVTPPAGDETWSYTFANGDLGSSYSEPMTVTLNGVAWDFSMTGSTYFGFDSQNGRGLQMGKKAEPASEIVLSTEGISGTVTKIVLNTSGASGTDATLVVNVGDSQFGDSIKTTKTATDYTLEGSASGKVEFRWTLTAAAVYIKSIAIYTE